jgi:integrase
MTVDEVKLALIVLDLRERLIFRFAVVTGLRPGESFALRRNRIIGKTAVSRTVLDRRGVLFFVVKFKAGRMVEHDIGVIGGGLHRRVQIAKTCRNDELGAPRAIMLSITRDTSAFSAMFSASRTFT